MKKRKIKIKFEIFNILNFIFSFYHDRAKKDTPFFMTEKNYSKLLSF